jgi:nucleoside transporter
MNKSIRFRLFLMMVLELFIWGCWLPLIYGYLPGLGFSTTEQSWILNAFPIAAIVGMFFSTQFADRNFDAEKFMAFSHFVGGLCMLMLAFTHSFWMFCAMMYVHCLLYVPTLSIANSIAFANIKDPQKEYGLIRVGGTIGWVLAAWPFTFIFVDWAKVNAEKTNGFVSWLGTVLSSPLTGPAFQSATRWTFIVAGVASLILAAYSLTLPHTPPKKSATGMDRFAWLEAMRLLKHPFIAILWIVTLIDSFVLYAYFNWTGVFLGTPKADHGVGIAANWIMPVMSIGQVMETLTMLVLGVTLKKLGWRVTMIIGILGHAVRFGIYAFYPDATAVIIVQLVHGVCYAFFFATVYIFVDEYFPKDVRSSAQGLFNAAIYGLGALLANSICPWLIQKVFTANGLVDFRGLFLVPLAAASLGALALALFFWPPPKPAASAGNSAEAA